MNNEVVMERERVELGLIVLVINDGRKKITRVEEVEEGKWGRKSGKERGHQ